MIEVVYRNRLGNRLFQYCYGRILSEALRWRLKCDPIPGFPGTYEVIGGDSFDHPVMTYDDLSSGDPRTLAAKLAPQHVVLRGWFQCYTYYAAYAAQIRKWVMPAQTACISIPDVAHNDILLHLRLGRDYESKLWILAPEFYEESIESVSNLGKVYICYDIRENASDHIRQRCLDPFLKRGAIVHSSCSALDDFNFARKFKRIAIAASTFCWWAAFLSGAEQIFFPKLSASATSCWGEKNANFLCARLEVDEPRYRYLKAKTLWD